MTQWRTELHDDLRALIAAGRELSPDDDAVLADMFLDRLSQLQEGQPTRRSHSMRTVRRGVGAAVLALALLTGGALVSVQQSSHHSQSSVPQPAVMKVGPNVKVLPAVPSGKHPQVPVNPVSKYVPIQPKG